MKNLIGKFVVIRGSNDQGNDYFIHDTIQEANEEAWHIYENNLTISEQKKNYVYVVYIKDGQDVEEGLPIGNGWTQGMFDSEEYNRYLHTYEEGETDKDNGAVQVHLYFSSDTSDLHVHAYQTGAKGYPQAYLEYLEEVF